MSLFSQALLLSVMAVPLALAALVLLSSMRAHVLRVLPVAPLPALAASLAVPQEAVAELPYLLLGMRLELSLPGAVFLGFGAFLWCAAGVHAATYMAGTHRPIRFAVLWLLTLAGSLGVFVAGDVATFYTAFACLSLAAYPLVVHDQSDKAMRAGRVYIVLAMIGETALLLGFLIAATGAQSLVIAEIGAGLADIEYRHVALALIVTGFGIKAGLVPLHVWLPLAHPAAPTPASAVLSGVIVKAGIFGLMQFLPLGSGIGFWPAALLSAGLFTAFYGVAAGILQTNPKTVLAYSTLSQMGLVVALLGTALAAGDPAPALAAAALYALHHGLAKGALFMGVALAGKGGRGFMAATAMLCLSIAGLPLTGGALAKLAIKPYFGDGIAYLLVTVSAAGTTLLLTRFVFALAAQRDDKAAAPRLGLVVPWAAAIMAAFVLPWLLFPMLSGSERLYAFEPANLWSATWPVLAGLAVVAAVLALPGGKARITVPEGDLVVVYAAALRMLTRALSALDRPFPKPVLPAAAIARMGGWLDRTEASLALWPVAGMVLALFLLAPVLVQLAGG